jgi:hypothetical protein
LVVLSFFAIVQGNYWSCEVVRWRKHTESAPIVCAIADLNKTA